MRIRRQEQQAPGFPLSHHTSQPLCIANKGPESRPPAPAAQGHSASISPSTAEKMETEHGLLVGQICWRHIFLNFFE